MQSPITDREKLIRLAAMTLEAVESGEFALASDALEGTEAPAFPGTLETALAGALDWARLEGTREIGAAALESVPAGYPKIPYLPSNQVLSLLQSAYDEYTEELSGKAASGLEVPFDHTDPGWVTVALEKLKALIRGKRPFIKHSSPASFRYDLPSDAVVALFSDWGTGEATAQRVMQQIRAAQPTHAIHLGDVYYSGTPREIEKRFLAVIDEFGPKPSNCRYFALNSNHEMYSGGYGYFDTTLPRFGQEASYFNLRNADWQLVGVDSGYEDHGLKDPQHEWLAAQLQSQAKSILLSHHQLFSPYEDRAFDRKLSRKTADLLTRIHAWFWGHEHKCIIFGDHLGIKARCIGHGAIPGTVPYGPPKVPGIPVLQVDERVSPEGGNIHGFALLRFSGKRLDVSYIDEFGSVFAAERLDREPSPGFFISRGMTEGIASQPEVANAVSHYKRLLKAGESVGSLESMGGFEEGAGSGEPDLSPPAIKDRVERTRAELRRIVKDQLGGKADLYEIADQIAEEGRASLEKLEREAPEEMGDIEQMTGALEVIVRTDGSRPSFMIQNGKVNTTTSPVGVWGGQLAVSAELLDGALSCVGRIDVPSSLQGFEGTGFLIHENLIVTNRHVLQAVARPNAAGSWVFRPGAAIDFGHEFRGLDSVAPRRLKQVVYVPSRVISAPIDHTKLDLVLIELEPVQEADRPRSVLAFDMAPDWAAPGQFIYTVGYPGNPGLGEPLSLLEQLFQSTFGCKRLAPGQIMPAASAVFTWTLAHDASTLGGNSGSVVLTAGREGAAAGLHYGGTRANPRENWGHILGRVLTEPDKASGKSLVDILKKFGVQLVDRNSA